MKPAILFVDDEPNLLSGLRRLSRRRASQWDMEFVSSGDAALAALEQRSFNLVISDMRMPGMDGARLLELISQKLPGIFRFALSGESDAAQAIRIVGRSHRFLAKPIEPDTLFQAIDNLFTINGSLLEQHCGLATSVFDVIKIEPGRLAMLRKLVAHPNDNATDIVAHVMSDPGLAVRLLQIVNSAYFGKPLETVSIPRAVAYIGVPRLAQILDKGRFGEERAGRATGDDDSVLHARAAIAARQSAEQAGFDEHGRHLAYATALLSGLGRKTEHNAKDCASEPACIAALFGLPMELVDSLRRFAETMDEQPTAEAIATHAVAASSWSMSQMMRV